MKKVIHMISSMNIGGAETMVKDYALLMDKEQFDVKIISLDKCYHSANEQFLERAQIPVIHLSELRYSAEQKLNLFQKMVRKIARYYDLRKIIKDEKPDILHVHLYIGKYLKYLSLKKMGIKLLYTVHNVPSWYYDSTGKDKEKYSAYKEILRLLKKEDLTLIALHDEMNEELRRLFHTKRVVTVNNGISLDRFHKELYNRAEVRKMLGIADGTLLLGHVGRFHEQKNQEFIVEILNEICKRGIEVHLLLIGAGPTREPVEEQITRLELEEKVTILSNRKDIPELMCAMDVFVFPSRWEGFGNVMIEAQSMELPCVVSDRIPSNVIVNPNVTVLSLDTPVSEWADCVTQRKVSVTSDKIQQYDMKNSVRKLEKIYLDEEN